MKTIIAKALAVLGLVPAHRYAELSRRVKELGGDLASWKKRAIKGERRERALQAQARDLETRLQKQARWMSIGVEQQRGELSAMQAQLAEVQAALTLTREHLMAIEVKLEILEGAANVLDARTRAQISGGTAGSAARPSFSA